MKADKLRIINSSHKSLPTVQVKKTIQAFVLRKDSSVKTYIYTVKIFQRLQRIWKNTECIS